ncbi:MAG: hypothetical protein KDC67_15995 [Ignavibacteriae bacterium]|nr:hypothetical protein [Ignavibacteriota bacterium]
MMNRKKIYLLLLISNSVFAQNLQNYSGEYEDNYRGYGEGIAEYTYYENEDYERIKEGKFIYSSSRDFSSDKTNINGSFSENKQNGKWVYKKTDDKYSVEIIGNYLNGNKNGKWTFNQNNENFYTLTFKNDLIIGDINLRGINGQFDENGKFIGKWTLKDGDYEFILEFQDNVLIKFIERKVSTGKLYCKYTPDFDFENLKKTKDFNSNIYGLSPDYDKSREQKSSFRRFFKELRKRIVDLQEDENRFILLSYFQENEPEFYVN